MPIQFPDEQDSGVGQGGKYLRVSKIKDMPKKQVRIRVVGDFIGGMEGWDTNTKPWRGVNEADLAEKMKAAGAVLRVEKDKKNPKPFRACPIDNVTEGIPQVLCFTQLSIYWQIKDLARKEEWGPNGDYDILITYSEKDGKVSYTVTPCKPTPRDPELKAKWAEIEQTWLGLDALFHGGDPFAPFGSDAPPKDEVPF